MATQEQVVLTCLDELERGAALEAFARLVPQYTERTCAGAELFKVEREGELIAYYALEVRERERELEGRILVAAALRNELDLTERVLPLVVKQFRNVARVSLGTHRPGLARKLVRRGWHMRSAHGGRFELERAAA